MNKIILSLNIPTYNRPEEFQRMLLKLRPQLTQEIEVVVRDDSSNLKSKEAFDRILGDSGIPFQYYKGEKIGVDAACLFMLEKSVGEFIWFFGDDDELLEGAIAEVIRLIKSNKNLNLIFANFDTDTVTGIAIKNCPAGYFKSGSEALEVLGTAIGLASSQIYRREIGLTGVETAKKYLYGFSFVSTCIYLHVLSGAGDFYFLAGPYVFCHPTKLDVIIEATNRTGEIINDGFNVYGVEFYKIVKEFEGKFERKSIRKILSTNFGTLWRGMLVGTVRGWDTPKGKLWRMFKLYWTFPEFWIALPCFLMPLWMSKTLYKIYRVFFSQRAFNFKKNIQNPK